MLDSSDYFSFFQGISKLSNTNQNLNTQMLLGYTMGGSSFRFIDGEINFDKTSHSVGAIINSNKATFQIEVISNNKFVNKIDNVIFRASGNQETKFTVLN